MAYLDSSCIFGKTVCSIIGWSGLFVNLVQLVNIVIQIFNVFTDFLSTCSINY